MTKKLLNRFLFFRVCPTLQQDAELLTRQSQQRNVILFYDDEPDEVLNFFLFCTNFVSVDPSALGPTYQIVHVYGNGTNEERILKKTLTKALRDVRLEKTKSSNRFLSFVLESLDFISLCS